MIYRVALPRPVAQILGPISAKYYLPSSKKICLGIFCLETYTIPSAIYVKRSKLLQKGNKCDDIRLSDQYKYQYLTQDDKSVQIKDLINFLSVKAPITFISHYYNQWEHTSKWRVVAATVLCQPWGSLQEEYHTCAHLPVPTTGSNH